MWIADTLSDTETETKQMFTYKFINLIAEE